MGWRVLKLKEVKHEKCTRKTFSKIGDYIEMPNLIQVQKDSYNWFIEEGLGEVLKDREKTIIELRFGLDGHKPKTQHEISEMMGISRSYVSRIETKAIGKLSNEFKED